MVIVQLQTSRTKRYKCSVAIMFLKHEVFSRFLNVLIFEGFNICCLYVRWQTVPRSRSCNTKSTFTETETTAENKQVDKLVAK